MQTQKFKSDGGSSDYYKIKIVRAEDGAAFECEVGDIIYTLVGGDFDLGNIIKACRRMYLDSKGGGKEGIDAQYDANKIKWFVDDYVKRVARPKEVQKISDIPVQVDMDKVIKDWLEKNTQPTVTPLEDAIWRLPPTIWDSGDISLYIEPKTPGMELQGSSLKPKL